MVHETDVCVLGAGPTGAMAAIALSRFGIPCILLEKDSFPRDKVCGDAFSGKVTSILRRLAPDLLASVRVQPFHLGSWGLMIYAPGSGSLRLAPANRGSTDPPGFLARRLDFDAFLARGAAAREGVRLLEGWEARYFEAERDHWLIHADAGRSVKARILIAADGAHSRFARDVAEAAMDRRHHAAGVRVYYEGVGGLDPDGFAELFFLRSLIPGYLWVFPLPGGRANVGVTVGSDRVGRQGRNLRDRLADAIREEPLLRDRFASARPLGEPMGWGLPLGSRRLPISGEGWMLAGDAASLIDPFTGEGIGNGMISGVLAAQTAAAALASGERSVDALAAYDVAVWKRLGAELDLSRRIRRFAARPWLLDLLIARSRTSPTLQAALAGMFDDVEVRDRLGRPGFYLRVLLGR